MTSTPPSPLDLARDDLARIDRDIAALQEERSEVAAFIKRYGKYVRPNLGDVRHRTRETPIAPSAKLLMPMSLRIANFMAKYLSEMGRPVELPDFYPVLEENGLVPGGTNPKQAVSAILGKDKRFTFVPKEGWRLAPTGGLPPGTPAADMLNLS